MVLEDCRCVNSHDKGVVILAIDHMSQNREDLLNEYKKRKEPGPIYYQKRLEEDLEVLKETRKRITDTPTC